VSEANARPTGPSARARASQSPNCIRQRVGRAGHHGVAQGRRIQNPRHGRMQFCATPLARSCRPFHGFLSTMLPRVAGKRGTSVRSRTKAPMNRTHSRRFARSGARHRKSRQRVECGRFSAAVPEPTEAVPGWQGSGGKGMPPGSTPLPPFLCPSPRLLRFSFLRFAEKRAATVRSRTKAPMNRTHSRRFARSGARHRKSRQRLECGRFSAAFPAWTGAASGWQGNGGRGTSPSFISLPPFLCPSPAALGGGVGRKPGLTARRDRLG